MHDAPPTTDATDRAEAGRYFRFMADYVGLTPDDLEAIRESRPIIARHLPSIVARFYIHLLRYPRTRALFEKKDGSIDEEYILLRMRHLSNFWLRVANADFDDEFAAYIDYVGKAHTSRGADPSIYIPERYVVGQVGMIQNAISEALSRELRDRDDEVEFRAVEAWDKLMVVILEMLSRAYGHEKEPETFADPLPVDEARFAAMAAHAVDIEHGEHPPRPTRAIDVAGEEEIQDGARRLVEVDGLSIGVFHHKGAWYAVRNRCLHRGGPVATGALDDDVLTCPWHGFQYMVTTGRCLSDPDAELDRYEVTVEGGRVMLHVPIPEEAFAGKEAPPPMSELQANQFRLSDIPPGRIGAVSVDGADVAVYNVEGTYYATQDECTHAGGSLIESDLEGKEVICYLHGSCFDVTTGAVTCGPADEPLQTYRVTINGEIGQVEKGETSA